MKNETEKLNRFKLAVFSEVEQQAQDIINEAQTLYKQRLSEAKDETQEELLNETGKIDKQCEAKKLHEVSSRRLEAQRNILVHRGEMMDKVFENICKNLAEFCKTEDYAKELKKRLDSCAQQTGQAECTAYFAKKDIELGTELCKGTQFKAEVSQGIQNGGVLVVCAGTGLAYDCTFDSTLEREKQNFLKASGLAQI